MCSNLHNSDLQEDKYMEIRTFGEGERLAECEGVLSGRLSCREGELILLPIPTVRDRYINGTDLTVDEILPMIQQNTAVAGYNIPKKIADRAGEVGASVFDAALCEEFLTDNAELTARGTLGYILTNMKTDLSEMQVGVVGYGRIGMRLIRLLLIFGAKITLYTRRRKTALDMCEMGISASVIGDECDFSGLDMLINTAPARQIDESALPESTRVIDLASGSAFSPSERVVRLPSIPDRYYPLTAGRLYAKAILGNLWGEEL